MAKYPLDISDLASEMAESNFDDERLNRRLKLIVEALASDPSASLPRALDSAALEATYRFFSNTQIDEQDILRSHLEATKARCAQRECLVVHDTTMFSYRFDGERRGLGRLQRAKATSKQVFFAHTSLAVSADGLCHPLGLAALQTWTRGPKPTGVESLRWEEQIRGADAQLGSTGNAIHLADREADDYAMFYALQRDKLRFVVRCQFDRRVVDTEATHLRELLAATPMTVEREVTLNRRKPKRNPVLSKTYPPREARIAKLCVAARTVELKRPKNRSPHAGVSSASLTVNVVRVWERDPPVGLEPVEWYLYTSEPIATAEQQLAVVDYYRARWTIEEYFKAIKTGCDFERRQLQDYEALINLLATFAPIAYRLLLIRTLAAQAPDEPAPDLLSKDHLDVLRTCGRRPLATEPTAREIYLAIAALGGHLKHSGNPGWLTLARGFEKLEVLTRGWRAAKLQPASDQG